MLFLEDLFPVILKDLYQEKSLPFTVAGQQWIFTIFPSSKASCQPGVDRIEKYISSNL